MENNFGKWVVVAMGFEYYEEDYMQDIIKFLDPHKNNLLSFNYMILNIDNFEAAYGELTNNDIVIDYSIDLDVVVYKNINNVRW